MKVALNKPLVVKDDNANTILELGINAIITPIRIEYLPRNVHIANLGRYNQQNVHEIDENYYVIYIRGIFLVIEKNDCYVPKYIGWKYNF